ncbi:MAG: TolC family protein [Planctomycetes bacterium]|nr:TolC family protein [Planctomycetota bacterium]
MRITVSTIITLFVFGCLFLSGCSRKHYRDQTDKEVYALTQEKAVGRPWDVGSKFTIEADRRSRLYDPSDPNFPVLPKPGPSLYEYQLPKLSEDGSGTSRETARRAATDNNRPPSQYAPPQSPDPRSSPESAGLPIQPIPKSYWDAIPRQCLARMLEFESVRAEYSQQYDASPPADVLDHSPRLSLDVIVKGAVLNSREYQLQKERLYRSALALSLERFDYTAKFSTGGSRIDTTYSNSRSDGTTTERMEIGPRLQVDKMLATGGSLLARFANSIVLTFGGPQGFTQDISSELLFGFTQSIFQRDIQLNRLVQSERDLVYAARDYARFRRQFFFQLASQYYGLLRNYRNTEIESQNYFSLIRTFEQARAEMRADVQRAPNPVAVDQYEQTMLSGRSGLITTCNRLEQDLDSLKLSMGLPTEIPINLDLTELEQLTLRDEIDVSGERVRRWRKRLLDHRTKARPQRSEILNANIFLLERLLEWLSLLKKLDRELSEAAELQELLAGFRIDQARVEVERHRMEFSKARDPAARSPLILVYQRINNLMESLLGLMAYQVELADWLNRDQNEIAATHLRTQDLQRRLSLLRSQLGGVLQDHRQEKLPGLLEEAEQLRQDIDRTVDSLDRLIAATAEAFTEKEKLQEVIEKTDQLLKTTERLLDSAKLGLPPVSISVDEAMVTALVRRLDLMNQRGRLADDWRQIKLAADDLKSVLNLSASYSMGTDDNKPFNFSGQDDRTQVGLSFDLPLNRRAQRNSYRRALIEYQEGRRGLMALEDNIKFDIRSGLRSLAETRIQYPISVTRASLAAEQVISVRLQLALGVQGIRSTDLLDALQSSREALIAVANARIGYIIDRAEFVFNLEMMQLDRAGLWPEINDSEFQPEPDFAYPEGAGPTYGDIPKNLRISTKIRTMVDYPLPGENVMILEADKEADVSKSPTPSAEKPGKGPDTTGDAERPASEATPDSSQATL